MPIKTNIRKLLSKKHDKNFSFSELVKILHYLGFKERIKGDHHIFTKKGIKEIINIQPRKDGTSKPYQIKQIRKIIIDYKLDEMVNSNGKQNKI